MKAARQASMSRELANAPTQVLAAEQLRLVTTAARLYHTHHERQAEIAEKLGISQAGVSRLLRQAEELGIVPADRWRDGRRGPRPIPGPHCHERRR